MKRPAMLSIDGARGEGGGQILRSALGLSLVTGIPFRIVHVRAGRRKPGLLRQHLTALQAAVAVGDGAADGAELGSGEVVFRPGTVRPGEYRFAVGTAGSTLLVLQTVLPALMLAAAPSRLILEGGTHNPFAPTFDFLLQTFLPALARFGPKVQATLERPGFYPAGGGRLHIDIEPVAALQQIELRERGAESGGKVIAHLAALDPQIAERAFAQILKRMHWKRSCCQMVEHPARCGPGFVLSGQVVSSEIVETFTGFGEKALRAEEVADLVVDQMRHYAAGTAPVGEFLSDQLLLPMALSGGGVFRSMGLSLHARTNMEVIEEFLPVKITAADSALGGVDVRVENA